MDSTMEPTITRRKVLKRAAVGAAGVWSVPLFASAASAKSSRGLAGNISACSTTSPNTGFLVPSCEFQNCGHVNGTDCFCYPGARAQKNGVARSSGCCACAGNEFCSQSPPCPGGPAQCPAGWKCTFNFCGGQTCVPPCGQGIAIASGAGANAAGV